MADRPNFKAIDRLVLALPKPAAGNKTYSEAELRRRGLAGPWVRGLAPRVTAADARAWVMRYRAEGIERLHTIGSIEAWPAEKVWPEAAELRRMIDTGADPRKERKARQDAPTVADLADRFEAEHLTKRRAATARDYRMMLRLYVRPELGNVRVAAVRRSDIDKLHGDIASGKLTPKRQPAPYTANRVIATLSKMFALAIGWEMRADNPARGIEREPEEKRQRFLSLAEIARLSAALAAHPEQSSANATRLLLLTGARRGEALSASWDQFDLGSGVWLKPAATTKQKKDHRLPLSAPALQLLAGMKTAADKENERRTRDGLPALPFLFPGKDGKPQTDIKHFWAAICKKADLQGVRVHDLRHTYASILASSGLSLPIIGALLGHTQMQTTQRYAHLMDDPLRAATERAGAIIDGAGREGADVVPIGGRRA
jgi:integrase